VFDLPLGKMLTLGHSDVFAKWKSRVWEGYLPE
jgi:hypothetical protein